MNNTEAVTQADRLKRYNLLMEEGRIIRAFINQLEDQKSTKSAASPFTHNTRETRVVQNMRIFFSATKGGEQPVDLYLSDVGVDARTLGDWLRHRANEKLTAITAQIEMI